MNQEELKSDVVVTFDDPKEEAECRRRLGLTLDEYWTEHEKESWRLWRKWNK